MDLFLNFINQFQPLTEVEFNAMSEGLQLEQHKKGTFLIKEQQYCNRLYFVQKGSARAFFNKDGKEVTTWFAFENQVLTSYYSFISQKKSLESIQLLEDTTLYSIHYDNLQQLYTDFHGIERLGRKITEFYYQWQEERLFSLQFHTAKERYEKLLIQEPHLLQKAALGHIASYLGITQETLSRIRKK